MKKKINIKLEITRKNITNSYLKSIYRLLSRCGAKSKFFHKKYHKMRYSNKKKIAIFSYYVPFGKCIFSPIIG
jgi:hypothetical protein